MSRCEMQLKAAERMEKKGIIKNIQAMKINPRDLMVIEFHVTRKGYDQARKIFNAMTTEERMLIRAYLSELEKQNRGLLK